MTIYDTRQRCPMCRNHGLPCNEAVHGRQTALHPVMALPAAPPRRSSAATRARVITTVALICIMLAAGVVAIGLVAAITLTGGEPCAGMCAPVDLASMPAPPPR